MSSNFSHCNFSHLIFFLLKYIYKVRKVVYETHT